MPDINIPHRGILALKNGHCFCCFINLKGTCFIQIRAIFPITSHKIAIPNPNIFIVLKYVFKTIATLSTELIPTSIR